MNLEETQPHPNPLLKGEGGKDGALLKGEGGKDGALLKGEGDFSGSADKALHPSISVIRKSLAKPDDFMESKWLTKIILASLRREVARSAGGFFKGMNSSYPLLSRGAKKD